MQVYEVTALPPFGNGKVAPLKTLKTTPLKTNMSPENQWLEDVFPIEIVPCLGTC